MTAGSQVWLRHGLHLVPQVVLIRQSINTHTVEHDLCQDDDATLLTIASVFRHLQIGANLGLELSHVYAES